MLEPRLASLLRPHQIDGITFCITCLLGGEPERISSDPSQRQFGPGHLPEGRALSAFQGGAILADDMGLGKTAQSLAIAYTLIRQGPFGDPSAAKALIVCPTTLTFNWNREIIKWIGMERVRAIVVSSGDAAVSQIDEFITSPIRKVCIISYELLSKCAPLPAAPAPLVFCFIVLTLLQVLGRVLKVLRHRAADLRRSASSQD